MYRDAVDLQGFAIGRVTIRVTFVEKGFGTALHFGVDGLLGVGAEVGVDTAVEFVGGVAHVVHDVFWRSTGGNHVGAVIGTQVVEAALDAELITQSAISAGDGGRGQADDRAGWLRE